MAENNFLTNGELLLTLKETSINSNVGLNLIGRNAINFGNPQNENFVHLLENFAETEPPSISSALALTPLTGTLWWNTTTDAGGNSGGPRLHAYDGVNWMPVSERTVANTAPSTYKLGDQWFDNVNKQLRTWTGTDWRLIGPGYNQTQGKSGTFVETVWDGTFSQVPHQTLVTYVANTRVSITSFDTTSWPAPGDYTDFTTISPGINLAAGYTFNGKSQDTNLLNGVEPQRFARNDIKTIFAQEIETRANLSFSGKANIFQDASAPHMTIQNTDLFGGVDFYLNTASGNVNVLHLDGVTGLVRTADKDPNEPLDITPKRYVDTLVSQINANIAALAFSLGVAEGGITDDYNAKIAALAVSEFGNLQTSTAAIQAAIAALQGEIVVTNAEWRANAAFQQTTLGSLTGTVATLAPIINPIFVGNPQITTTPDPGDNTHSIPDTAYVDRATNTLQTDYLGRISALNTSLLGTINAAVVPLAPKASPLFTGTPAYNPIGGVQPTTPTWTKSSSVLASGDNSNKLASTAFVIAAVAGQKMNYTVSLAAPAGGNDGDFWFQIQ